MSLKVRPDPCPFVCLSQRPSRNSVFLNHGTVYGGWVTIVNNNATCAHASTSWFCACHLYLSIYMGLPKREIICIFGNQTHECISLVWVQGCYFNQIYWPIVSILGFNSTNDFFCCYFIVSQLICSKCACQIRIFTNVPAR